MKRDNDNSTAVNQGFSQQDQNYLRMFDNAEAGPEWQLLTEEDWEQLNNKGDNTELWITNPGTSIFYNYGLSEQEKKKNDNENSQANQRKLNGENASYDMNIERYTTLMASPRIFGMPFYYAARMYQSKLFFISCSKCLGITFYNNGNNNNGNETKDDDPTLPYHTLPSWIKKANDGSIWFNQQQGNKISKFEPSEQELVEYWIPSQNNEWGNCEEEVVRSDVQDSIGKCVYEQIICDENGDGLADNTDPACWGKELPGRAVDV